MRWIMTGVGIRCDDDLMFMKHRCRMVVHRFVLMLCGRRGRRAEGHRRGGVALKRQREQRYPDDQDSQEGIHLAILA